MAVDCGCGNGRDSLQLLRSGFRVFAFDRQPEAVELTRTLLAKEDAEGAEVVEGGFEDVQLPPCDFVIASLSLFFATPPIFASFLDPASRSPEARRPLLRSTARAQGRMARRQPAADEPRQDGTRHPLPRLRDPQAARTGRARTDVQRRREALAPLYRPGPTLTSSGREPRPSCDPRGRRGLEGRIPSAPPSASPAPTGCARPSRRRPRPTRHP